MVLNKLSDGDLSQASDTSIKKKKQFFYSLGGNFRNLCRHDLALHMRHETGLEYLNSMFCIMLLSRTTWKQQIHSIHSMCFVMLPSSCIDCLHLRKCKLCELFHAACNNNKKKEKKKGLKYNNRYLSDLTNK